MNTKRLLKTLVSLVLTVMMLASIMTSAFASVSAAETGAVSTGADTRTIYVGVISYLIRDSKIPQVHYWGGGVDSKVSLAATSETVKYAVGSSYWNNAE